jgi:hypothetical protein
LRRLDCSNTFFLVEAFQQRASKQRHEVLRSRRACSSLTVRSNRQRRCVPTTAAPRKFAERIIRVGETAKNNAAAETPLKLLVKVTMLQVAGKPYSDLLVLSGCYAFERVAPERPPAEFVDLPFGYVVAISFEEQPAGMCLHVSVSGPWPRVAPNMVVCAMIFNALNVPDEAEDVWTEELLII